MRHLKLYENFDTSSDDTLFIFDFDDTLVDSPKFEELAIEYLKEDVTIKSLLNRSVNYIGKKIEDIKWENGRLYIPDPNQELEIKGNWVRKKGRVYLISPDRFYFTDMSFPKSLLKTADIYKEVKNKAIVTGRIITVKPKIKNKLKELELEEPNWGLHCYPSTVESLDRVATWKAKTIVELIKKSGFKKARFYEDKSKWLNKVKLEVAKNLPDVEFIGIKV
jgi:FMN phosphatase YigB (HAD superfamily)